FVYQESLRPLVDRAEVIKVDVLGLEDAEIARQFGQLQAFPVKYLAEKVETQEQFEFCRDLGFDYFQGHFLSHPKVIQGRRITTNRMPVLRLLAELNSPDARVDKLETLIGQDISLSYRLLRYINSAFFNLTREVDSINHALVLLGLKDVRRWATLISLAESSDKPHELMVTAMVRAKMCELLAEELGESNPDGFFTVGLFSVLDALMDAPMEEMLEALPLSEDISQALLAHEGKFGKVLSCTLAYEDGNWKDVSILDMEPGKVRAAYLEAITWVDQADLALQESS
ncbi:MAG: EAL and HDOD domain-containing protein, partial [Leptospirillia bacterium]